MMMATMGGGWSRYLVLLLQLVVLLYSAPGGVWGQYVLGHGYAVRSISTSPDGKSIAAKLCLINASDKYGPDIQNLDLNVCPRFVLNNGSTSTRPIYGFTPNHLGKAAVGDVLRIKDKNLLSLRAPLFPTVSKNVKRNLFRYETPTRLRVKITDSDRPRWEVPQEIIPRGTQKPFIHGGRRLLGSSTAPPPEGGKFSVPDSDLVFTYTTNPFYFFITRRSSTETLFDTRTGTNNDPDGSVAGLVFKDQFLSISTSLPAGSSSIYGLGEHTLRSFRLGGNDYLTLTMWNEDIGSSAVGLNLYGTHPFYVDLRAPSGKAHGVLLLNSNGMDVIYRPSQITYKIDGGILDFYFFAGDSPAAVVQQYTELIGRPAPMPYWSFGTDLTSLLPFFLTFWNLFILTEHVCTSGFHQCRYGYKNVEDLEGVVDGYAKAGIPLEVMWTDIDYMDQFRDFTVDPVNFPLNKMKSFTDRLHQNGQKYVLIVDPGINVHQDYKSYVRGLEADIYIKRNGQPYLAQVWPGPVNFPDFMNPASLPYWQREIQEFHDIIPFDGLWIDMNEVSNFCSGTSCKLPANGPCPRPGQQTQCCLICDNSNMTIYDNPPYKINAGGSRRPLGERTLSASTEHYGNVLEYNAHGLYGLTEARATKMALANVTQKRPFVLSRSTFVGSGVHTAHWTGDNSASWDDLAFSISGMLNFGLFGVPMVGSDICGFNGQTNEELCNRWIQLGAFYPFSRNHATITSRRQELYLWETVTESAKKALGLRYKLLPYYYTLMYQAHLTGSPIARPLFYSFADDINTHGIDKQFLIGKGLMVSPILRQGQSSVDAYFPAGTWFDMFDLNTSLSVPSGRTITLDAPLEKINVHVRAGSVLPMQEVAATTAEARKTPFTLLVALGNGEGAEGELFLDDGEQVEMGGAGNGWTFMQFHAVMQGNAVKLSSQVQNGDYALGQKLPIETVVVVGLKPRSQSKELILTVNGNPVDVSKVKVAMEGKGDNGVAVINGLCVLVGQNFELTMQMA
ncbi:putative alpha-glucosidase [Nymphaea thermarum]|nr:putative alpha-glucosidase [Nymphaea thermarum]